VVAESVFGVSASGVGLFGDSDDNISYGSRCTFFGADHTRAAGAAAAAVVVGVADSGRTTSPATGTAAASTSDVPREMDRREKNPRCTDMTPPKVPQR
jgi:hypothetical protein